MIDITTLLLKKYSQQHITNQWCVQTVKIFLIAFLAYSSNGGAVSNGKSECILNNKIAIHALSRGGFSGEFGCKYGSRFLRVNGRGGGYIIYNYIYRFSVSAEGAVHGGQRIIFFNSGMEYIGQFLLDAPYNDRKYQSIIPKRNLLIINDGSKNVGEILLSNPPSGVLYNESLDFFK